MTTRPPIFQRPKTGALFVRPELDRPSAAKRGYGREWRAIRAAFLAEHPSCAACSTAATEVDHIVSLRSGGSNAASNLRPLCKPCHARKTVRVDGALGRKNLWEAEHVDPCSSRLCVSAKSQFEDWEA